MANRVLRRLEECSLTLPVPFASKAGNYVPFVRAGDLLFIAGQGPMDGGSAKFFGKVGGTLTAEQGYQAARLTGLNILTQASLALGGDLDRVVRCLRLFGLINSTAGYTGQAQAMNGASDLMVEVFGDAGRHARTTIGASALPHDMTVEIEALFAVE
ncbi:MAG: RidA family protein [Alphaproteobacteria bacterium]|nr:RidA family protein [Alphaproteobacteria bacterium]